MILGPLLVLCLMILASVRPVMRVQAPVPHLLIVCSGIFICGLTAWIIAFHTARKLRALPAMRMQSMKQYQQLQRLHSALIVVILGTITFVTKWPHIIRINWMLNDTVLLDELGLLAPFLIASLVSWLAFYEVDHVLEKQGLVRTGSLSSTRGQHLLFQLRHHSALIFVPALLLITIFELLLLFSPSAVQQSSFLVAITLTFLCSPLLLITIWKTKPLTESQLREKFKIICHRSRVPIRDILVWETQDKIVNALVTGFLSRLRFVLMSDRLLSQFGTSELEYIFAHEIAHIKHHHLLLRILGLLPLGAILLVIDHDSAGNFSGFQTLPEWSTWCITMFITLLYIFSVFAYYSRRLERQADLYACRMLSCRNFTCTEAEHSVLNNHSVPKHCCPTSIYRFVQLLRQLEDSCQASHSIFAWQHFRLPQRIAFLESLLDEPETSHDSDQALSRLTGLFALVSLVAIVVLMF